ncbi:hypothetical protein CAEBREN_02167 [Caenorhabditis brenneri]|uniref:Uncharacterized protein n=1 Tax=Caenorhabditis brenneri TaxID=135651 RepID=G0NP80_CAEBE|nr:hypothetical protein CAEBREN_02167 [Caenorhabditis brenneri]
MTLRFFLIELFWKREHISVEEIEKSVKNRLLERFLHSLIHSSFLATLELVGLHALIILNSFFIYELYLSYLLVLSCDEIIVEAPIVSVSIIQTDRATLEEYSMMKN